MRKVKSLKPLTEEEIKKLEKTRKCCNSKYGVQYGDWSKTKKICNIILSINNGMKAGDVAKEYKVGRTTVFNYIEKYNENPNFMLHQQERVSELEQYEFDIAHLLRENRVVTYKDAYKLIKKNFNVNISYERTIKFLNTHDFIKDKNKGYFTHKITNAAKIRNQKNKNKKIKEETEKKSYLMEHLDEIEIYGMRLVDSYDGNKDYIKVHVAKRIKDKFPAIVESENVLIDILKNQTSVFW